ncbi:MAG: hypothetical protein ACJ71T_10150 [Actinomycetales bacterium]
MATSQRIIVTPVPAGLQLNPETIRVSIVISPRLSGEDRLGPYDEWLHWTARRQGLGLSVTFECAGHTLTVAPDTSQLRPTRWDALFDEDTYVRPYQFDDYSESFVPSYSTRTAVGLLKSTYQEAGIQFALPPLDGDPRERTSVQRNRFRDLIGSYGVAWDAERGARLREQLRGLQQQQRGAPGTNRLSAQLAAGLDPDGSISTGQLQPGTASYQQAQSLVASEYQVFNHQPQGADVTADSLDREHVLDFHQAISSLGSYPTLQRDLGLVFDLELPLDFVAQTGTDTPGELAIVEVQSEWEEPATTSIPPTRTAYVHAQVGDVRLFAVAPLAMTRPGQPSLLGLLDLDKRSFGVAQLDVDGALHRTIRHATDLSLPGGESVPPTADLFDPATALASLRSGGLSLFADSRALRMLDTFDRSARHNADLEQGQPQREAFFAEDLTRGYRLDIWDSVTRDWHSLHRRDTTIHLGQQDVRIDVEDEEGWFQAAATQAAPEADGSRANTDLHLHEAMARWSGWSLAAPAIGTHLTRDGDPDHALPDPDDPDPENEAVTPFTLTSESVHVKGSLPRLRFGVGYRLRLRRVDLAGNGLEPEDRECGFITPVFSMPRGEGVIPYLRYEPVVPPVLVVRDPAAISGRGSSGDRLVIRTFNTDESLDGLDADLAASDRHIAPPGVHVETAERHGMLDDASGHLDSSPAMWELVKDRDAGSFAAQDVPGLVIDGQVQQVPVDESDSVTALPYLPDPLARAAAFRDLPGTAGTTVGRVTPSDPAAGAVAYAAVSDAQPRPGTATLVEYGGRSDWQEVRPFRLALADGTAAPYWDPDTRLLTVSLPKGSTHVVRMSSCCDADDLKYLGVWSWLREYVEHLSRAGEPMSSAFYESPAARDRLAHVLQLAGEGAHPMITPPHLLTLVSAVQQPIGRPAFDRLTARVPVEPVEGGPTPTSLRIQPESSPTDSTELAVLSGWRQLGSTDAFLVGTLKVHGHSTAKVDLVATWTDPVDDLVADPTEQSFSAAVDEIPLPDLRPKVAGWTDNVLRTNGDHRPVGFYVRDEDLVAMAPQGTDLGLLPEGAHLYEDTAPRHRIGDTKHHVVSYTPVATSRYREYFDVLDGDGNPRDFTRTGDAVTVHVPASARPVAPQVRYVVPTFGWERVGTANQLRSVRTGGGLRVYLERPWNSSGADELLGVSLTSSWSVDREKWKGLITQWGQDPIWESASLSAFPSTSSFPDAVASEYGLPLDGTDPDTGAAQPVDVVGHEVHWDDVRKLYYCDLTVQTDSPTYMPFVRLALVRYQPYALLDAKLSRVVLSDFAQLTPERALTVTADAFTPGAVRLAVSGPSPRGPVPEWLGEPVADRPTRVSVTVQRKDAGYESDLAWVAADGFTVRTDDGDPYDPAPPDFILWSGSVLFTPGAVEQGGHYRLLVEEHEIYPADRPGGVSRPVDVPLRRPPIGTRLVYAETLPLDQALLGAPAPGAASTTV